MKNGSLQRSPGHLEPVPQATPSVRTRKKQKDDDQAIRRQAASSRQKFRSSGATEQLI